MELTPEEVRAWMIDLKSVEADIEAEAPEKAEAKRLEKAQARVKVYRDPRFARKDHDTAEVEQTSPRRKSRSFREGHSDRTGVPMWEARDMSDRPTQGKRPGRRQR